MTAVTTDLFTIYSDVLKANPYHDARGRFTTGPGGGVGLGLPKPKSERKSPSQRRQKEQLARVKAQNEAFQRSKAAAERAAKAAEELIKKPTQEKVGVWKDFTEKAIKAMTDPAHWGHEGTFPAGEFSSSDPGWKKVLIATVNVGAALGMGAFIGAATESPLTGIGAAVSGVGLYVMNQWDKYADERHQRLLNRIRQGGGWGREGTVYG